MTKTISIALFFTAALVLVGCNNIGNRGAEGWTAQGGPKMCPAAMAKMGGAQPQLLSKMISGATQDLMDQSDEKLARDAAARALENSPDGVSQYWMNPNTDKRGESKVLKTMDKGRCRVLYSNTLDDLDMQFGQETVTYCRGVDKNWSQGK